MTKLTTTEFNKIKKLLEKFTPTEIIDNKLSDRKHTTINYIKRSKTFDGYKELSQRHLKRAKVETELTETKQTGIVLVLKRCIKDNKAHNDFEYTEVDTTVEATDWIENNECGNGLHGWTINNWTYLNKGLQGNWVVLEVNKADGFIELGDKVKFRKGKILYNSPELQGAKDLMLKQYPDMVFHFDNQTAGDWSTQTAGWYATQTAGWYATQTAGNESTQTAGYRSTQTAGDNSFICNHILDGYINIVKPGKCSIVSSINIDTRVAKSFASTRDDITYVINGDCNIDKQYTTTPDNIEQLEDYEIIVFGSNLNGNHAGGLARLCADKFRAKEGIGEGTTGQCYAFPTLDKDMNKVTSEQLKESVEKLIQFANRNTGKIILLTKVGCGIAGFEEDEIKGYFKNLPANIIKPEGW